MTWLVFIVTVALTPVTIFGVELIAHRGVHQALKTDKPIGIFQCTADLIEGANHSYMDLYSIEIFRAKAHRWFI